MFKRLYLFAIVFLMAKQNFVFSQEAVININPSVSCAINGKLDLERDKFFTMCHNGLNFESTINNTERASKYVNELEISFGRQLGMVNSAVRWGNNVREDAARPGFADLSYLKSKSNPSNGTFSSAFKNRFPVNLGVANHDNHSAYPVFMPQVTTTQAGAAGNLPTNTDAAAELAVNLLKYNFTDWSRPLTYEPINEPHWSIDGTLLANLHLKIWQKAKDEKVSTLIGGPCMSVGYFYKNNYQYLSTLSGFIDKTQCKLDFYSFHVYDYMKWDANRNDIVGRVSTGLPLEGVLDLIPNYTLNKYGKPVELVFSEHGGYLSGNQENDLNTIANKYFPGSGFAWEMKRRSVSNFVMLSSTIANTMAFMNHPDIVKKSVPFILLESFAWDPKYYSSMLVANNFNDKSNWQEAQLVYFYEFFKDVRGRRVVSDCTSPDIQQHAFVDGKKVILVLNNLSAKNQPLKLNTNIENLQNIRIRRLGRNTDFTPYINENSSESISNLQLKGRESMVIFFEYNSAISSSKYLNEKPFYGTEVSKEYTGSKTFTVNIPTIDKAEYAILRVGISRPSGTDRNVNISINGNVLKVPVEDCAPYLENETEFATTKIIKIDKSLIKTTNNVIVNFTDGKPGGVGAVVIRVAYNEIVSACNNLPKNQEIKIYPNPTKHSNINVEFPYEIDNSFAEIFNISGKLIKRLEIKNTNMLEFALDNNTAKGVYLLKLIDNNQLFTQKFVVN